MSKFEKKIIEKENERLSKTKEKVIDLSYFVDEKKLKKMKSTPKDDSKEFNPMTFKIYPKEVEKLNKWMGNIIGVYGKYGNFEYSFKPTGGLGWDIWVYSDLAKTEICLTEDVDY
jgi:hypothetical protein